MASNDQPADAMGHAGAAEPIPAPAASHNPTAPHPQTQSDPAPNGHAPAQGNGHQPMLGAGLEPALRDACGGRLSDINWFRTDWQRGGALTGYARYADNGHGEHHVVVKFPVPPAERHWLVQLQDADHVVPKVYAHGETVGGYDLAWVVMERLPHGPLGAAWGGEEFDMVVEAIGRFYAAAEAVPRTGEPDQRDWEAVLERARQAARDGALLDARRWRTALKRAQKKLKQWLALWEVRPMQDWCHGDLHLGNAMTRHEPGETGPALLLDFARTRVGHWVEDAVYFEHLYWARRERLGGRKLGRQIANERKRQGLEVDPDWAELAQIKRALLAMSTPAQLRHEGDPQHVRAALEVLEAAVSGK